jgi:crotonobetainyl-CoA:carnitine CoA-transferase CaiB-like acyl-CoA transferase
MEALADDPRFRTNPDRVVHRDTLIPLLTEAIGARGAHEFSEALEGAGIPAGPINRLDQVFADPQVVDRGLGLGGDPPGLASPIVIDGERQVAERRSPRLGAGPDGFAPGTASD